VREAESLHRPAPAPPPWTWRDAARATATVYSEAIAAVTHSPRAPAHPASGSRAAASPVRR
jgi:hypothetical protein